VGASENAIVDRGYTCVFKGGEALTGFIVPSSLTGSCLYGGDVGGQLGMSVNMAGDVNGDGYDDVLAGGKGASGQKGKVYVLIGGESGVADCDLATCTPHAAITGINAGDWLAIVK